VRWLSGDVRGEGDFSRQQKNLIAAAEEMPADKFGSKANVSADEHRFRPSPNSPFAFLLAPAPSGSPFPARLEDTHTSGKMRFTNTHRFAPMFSRTGWGSKGRC